MSFRPPNREELSYNILLFAKPLAGADSGPPRERYTLEDGFERLVKKKADRPCPRIATICYASYEFVMKMCGQVVVFC